MQNVLEIVQAMESFRIEQIKKSKKNLVLVMNRSGRKKAGTFRHIDKRKWTKISLYRKPWLH